MAIEAMKGAGPAGEVALAADEGAVHQLVVDHLDALVAGDLGL